jgi:hypothetical protein
MSISYVAEFCPHCQKITVFKKFASYSGGVCTCMEEDCGFSTIIYEEEEKTKEDDDD